MQSRFLYFRDFFLRLACVSSASASLCEFIAASVPVIFPLLYTFPKLAALVSTFLAHRKLLRHDGNVGHPHGLNPAAGQDPTATVTKSRMEAVLE